MIKLKLNLLLIDLVKLVYAKIIDGINYSINNEVLELLHHLPNMSPANKSSYNINLVYKLSFNIIEKSRGSSK